MSAASPDLPFWSDDFDMDLPKVIPEARAVLGDLADLELKTHGSLTFGRLNHPTVWNGDLGTVAFFGRTDPCRPAAYYAAKEIVTCTLWEVLRDCWSHDYAVIFERHLILDGNKFWLDFQPLMYHMRSWQTLRDEDVAKHRDRVLNRIRFMVARLRRIIAPGHYGTGVRA